jgi:tellurite resistance protein
MAFSLAVELPSADPSLLRAAVRRAFATAPDSPASTVPPPARLRAGAEQVQSDETSDSEASRYFQALLEIGYLVASADGLAAEERQALAELLEEATGKAVDQAALKLHFEDLDQAVAMLGRHERLRRSAADLEELGAREEALGFATLVAIADGSFAEPEAEALVELGRDLAFSDEQIRSLVDQVVSQLKHALAS